MRLPDTVAETLGNSERRGLCPKQSAPLHTGNAALRVNRAPK